MRVTTWRGRGQGCAQTLTRSTRHSRTLEDGEHLLARKRQRPCAIAMTTALFWISSCPIAIHSAIVAYAIVLHEPLDSIAERAMVINVKDILWLCACARNRGDCAKADGKGASESELGAHATSRTLLAACGDARLQLVLGKLERGVSAGGVIIPQEGGPSQYR